MALVNEHFLKLPGSYLFSDIAKKVNTFKVTHPKQDIIRLGIGDVTRPLPQASIEAMHKAVEELTSKGTFRGYGPEQGYDFLIDAIHCCPEKFYHSLSCVGPSPSGTLAVRSV